MTDTPEKSYGQILKSTAIFGGSSAIKIVFGIFQVKIIAVLLGPAGVGLMGMYSSIMVTASGLTGMGLASSGVREIAEAEASGDAVRIASTRQALRWATLVLGLIGALMLVLLRVQISYGVFGDTKHAGAIAWLAIGVALSVLGGSQSALLIGMRRISDMARASVLGSLIGLVFSVALIWGLRERGIVFYLIAGTVTGYAVNYYFVRKLPRAQAPGDFTHIFATIKSLLHLGAAFMLSGLIGMGLQLMVRSLIVRSLGIEANGIFQAALTIAGVYLGLVLSSMGADYYPRLTGVAHDRIMSNRLVNEQTEVALLLAGPLILGMLTFCHLVVLLFYSSKFGGTIDILRWQLIGDIFKVISWPMGYLLMARSMKRMFVITNVLYDASFLFVVWAGIGRIGISITGIGYAFCLFCSTVIVYRIAYKANGLVWSNRVWKLSGILIILGIAITLSSRVNVWLGYVVGTSAVCGYSWHAVRSLSENSGGNIFRRGLSLFRKRR
ncbi:MAG: O-antigen translocase [bacterium]